MPGKVTATMLITTWAWLVGEACTGSVRGDKSHCVGDLEIVDRQAHDFNLTHRQAVDIALYRQKFC